VSQLPTLSASLAAACSGVAASVFQLNPFTWTLARTERDDGRLLRVVSRGKGCDLVQVSPFDFSVGSETVLHVTDSVVVAEDKVRVEASIAIAEQDFARFLDLPGWLKVCA
jgi:hypothetical protein